MDLASVDSAHAETRVNGLRRESRHVLDAAKSFLFDRGHQLAVADEHRRHVAVIRVDSEDVYRVTHICTTRHLPGATTSRSDSSSALERCALNGFGALGEVRPSPPRPKPPTPPTPTPPT